MVNRVVCTFIGVGCCNILTFDRNKNLNLHFERESDFEWEPISILCGCRRIEVATNNLNFLFCTLNSNEPLRFKYDEGGACICFNP